jgi:hypothetical protein
MDNLVKLHMIPTEDDTVDQTHDAGLEDALPQTMTRFGDRIGRLHAVPVTRVRPDHTNIAAANIEEVEKLEKAAALLTFRRYCSFHYATTGTSIPRCMWTTGSGVRAKLLSAAPPRPSSSTW